jgi:hypothetical protein
MKFADGGDVSRRRGHDPGIAGLGSQQSVRADLPLRLNGWPGFGGRITNVSASGGASRNRNAAV